MGGKQFDCSSKHCECAIESEVKSVSDHKQTRALYLAFSRETNKRLKRIIRSPIRLIFWHNSPELRKGSVKCDHLRSI
jgi:hypothetical protein